MTNKDKQLLASVLISAAANVVENMRCDQFAYMEEIKHLDPDAAAMQLAKWLKNLPGDVWDTRLPQP